MERIIIIANQQSEKKPIFRIERQRNGNENEEKEKKEVVLVNRIGIFRQLKCDKQVVRIRLWVMICVSQAVRSIHMNTVSLAHTSARTHTRIIPKNKTNIETNITSLITNELKSYCYAFCTIVPILLISFPLKCVYICFCSLLHLSVCTRIEFYHPTCVYVQQRDTRK